MSRSSSNVARARTGGGDAAAAGMTGNNPYDDAALARALQEEYEREYRRRSMQQHLGNSGDYEIPARSRTTSDAPTGAAARSRTPSATRSGSSATVRATSMPPPSAPPADEFFNDPFYTPVTNDIPPAELNFVLSGDTFGSVEVSDAAYAKQLEIELRREEEEERLRQIRKQQLQNKRDSFRASRSTTNSSNNSSQSPALIALSRSNTQSFSSHSNVSMLNPPRTLQQRDIPEAAPIDRHSTNLEHNASRNRNENMYPVVTGTSAYDDEEYARRLEQEMRDEELARQAFAEEQIRQSAISAQAAYANRGRAVATARARPRGRCYTIRRCLSCCVTLILSVILAALLYVFVFGQNGGNGLTFDPDQFRAEDPFNQANKEDANLWKTKGGVGLELSLINALDSNWHDNFYLAVQQWDDGTPDSLTLVTEVAEPESACSPVTGKLKVCNGNYGETNWRGINKVLLENGWIYSSAARMNEFYSSDNDGDQKQYTMCHEVSVFTFRQPFDRLLLHPHITPFSTFIADGTRIWIAPY
jgi:hypothetical protein